MKTLFTNAHLIIDDRREYLNGGLLVENDKIIDTYPHASKIKPQEDTNIINLEGKLIFPGFFDTHTHGIKGIDFNTATAEDLNTASLAYAQNGVTSFLATITNDNIIDTQTKHSRLFGYHQEGPYISPDYAGAFSKDKLKTYHNEVFNPLLCQMTIAPEIPNSAALINQLHNQNIKVMLGHTKVNKNQLADLNYDGYTHLFNAMPPLSSRNGSILNSFLNGKDEHYGEVIFDGVHIDKEVLSILLKLTDHHQLMAISDSTLATTLPDGEYSFLNQSVTKKGLSFKNKEGKLCGGVSTLAQQAKLLKSLHVDNTDILSITSLNAHRFYGTDRFYGSLIKGKKADIVVLDQDFNLVFTYLKGQFYYV